MHSISLYYMAVSGHLLVTPGKKLPVLTRWAAPGTALDVVAKEKNICTCLPILAVSDLKFKL